MTKRLTTRQEKKIAERERAKRIISEEENAISLSNKLVPSSMDGVTIMITQKRYPEALEGITHLEKLLFSLKNSIMLLQ